MTGAVYFVVTRRAGRESPALYYDQLPAWMLSKRAAAQGLIFAFRLDIRWQAMSLGLLWSVYQRLAADRKLPPSNLAPPPAKSEPRQRKLGEWWEPPPATWDRSAPAYPPFGK
jgi:hypothetical protein